MTLQHSVRNLWEHARSPRYHGVLRFSTVGGITTLGDFLIFTLLTVGLDVATIPANLMSYSCGIVASFLLNRNWTFNDTKSGGSAAAQGLRFAITNITGLGISTVLVALLALVLPRPVAKILSIPVVFVWNYLTARHWVFRNSQTASD
jgi:putative flippase GtrA